MYKIQATIFIEMIWNGYKLIVVHLKLTSWAIVSLAGVGLGKVEERQGEKQKNCHFLGKQTIWEEQCWWASGEKENNILMKIVDYDQILLW